MKITIVKKVKTDGSLCRKSGEVWEKLKEEKLLSKIDTIVFAHAGKFSSPGFSLAIKHQVTAAPFFIVEEDDGSTQVYTSDSDFLKEVLGYSSDV